MLDSPSSLETAKILPVKPFITFNNNTSRYEYIKDDRTAPLDKHINEELDSIARGIKYGGEHMANSISYNGNEKVVH